MGSHQDTDHPLRRAAEEERRREFMRELELRGEIMDDLGKNRVANQKALETWRHDGLQVQHLPDDRQGILRISIGGGDNLPVQGDYCNFRGDQGQCIALLERALEAMKQR